MSIYTETGICAFPSLNKPKKKESPTDDDRFGLAIIWKGLFPQQAPDHPINAMKSEAWACVVGKFGSHDKALAAYMDPYRKWAWPFEDGAKNAVKYPGFEAGDLVVNFSSRNHIGAVDRYKDPTTGKARVITNMEEIYPGCQVRAQVTFKWYDKGKGGVGAYVENVQKMGDGQRIDGRVAAADAFGAEEPQAAPMPGAAAAPTGALPF